MEEARLEIEVLSVKIASAVDYQPDVLMVYSFVVSVFDRLRGPSNVVSRDELFPRQ